MTAAEIAPAPCRQLPDDDPADVGGDAAMKLPAAKTRRPL